MSQNLALAGIVAYLSQIYPRQRNSMRGGKGWQQAVAQLSGKPQQAPVVLWHDIWLVIQQNMG